MKITPDVFDAYLKCPTKYWLRAAGEASEENPYAQWVKTQTDSYREAETTRMVADLPDSEVDRSPIAENTKSATWRLATGMSVQAEMDACVLASELHAVERVPAGGRGKAAQFIPIGSDTPKLASALLLEGRPPCRPWIVTDRTAQVPPNASGLAPRFFTPIRFIFTNKLGKDDKLLLAFDALALGKTLGRESASVKLSTVTTMPRSRSRLRLWPVKSGSGSRKSPRCFQTRVRIP